MDVDKTFSNVCQTAAGVADLSELQGLKSRVHLTEPKDQAGRVQAERNMKYLAVNLPRLKFYFRLPYPTGRGSLRKLQIRRNGFEHWSHSYLRSLSPLRNSPLPSPSSIWLVRVLYPSTVLRRANDPLLLSLESLHSALRGRVHIKGS